MLSRVAERLYWMSRYLERAENTARLMDVYTNLLLDLPSGVNIGWYNLVTLNGAESWFDHRYRVRNERNVMRFLLADRDYPGSIVASLHRVRENIRTTRDIVPAESWEYINELSLFVQDNIAMGVNRGQRHAFIAAIIKACQQFLGLFVGTMCEGRPRTFLRLGRNLERADMTTRILDAGTRVVLENNGSVLPGMETIVWGNVLRSLSAYLPYTRQQRRGVRGVTVARYLLEDPRLPRTIRYCCDILRTECANLPRHDAVLCRLDDILINRYWPFEREVGVLDTDFRAYLLELQLQLAEVHQLIAETWFTAE